MLIDFFYTLRAAKLPVSVKERNQGGTSPSDIIIYESGETEVEVGLEGETVWLSQAQMADLFGKDVRRVNEHISNIYDEADLEQTVTIRNFRIVRQEGKRQVQR